MCICYCPQPQSASQCTVVLHSTAAGIVASIPLMSLTAPQVRAALAGVIESVIERDSELQNPAVANVDQVLLVFSLAEPPWDGQVATRFLVSAEACGLPVTVLLNKADLVTEDTQEAIHAQVLGHMPAG